MTFETKKQYEVHYYASLSEKNANYKCVYNSLTFIKNKMNTEFYNM